MDAAATSSGAAIDLFPPILSHLHHQVQLGLYALQLPYQQPIPPLCILCPQPFRHGLVVQFIDLPLQQLQLIWTESYTRGAGGVKGGGLARECPVRGSRGEGRRAGESSSSSSLSFLSLFLQLLRCQKKRPSAPTRVALTLWTLRRFRTCDGLSRGDARWGPEESLEERWTRDGRSAMRVVEELLEVEGVGID